MNATFIELYSILIIVEPIVIAGGGVQNPTMSTLMSGLVLQIVPQVFVTYNYLVSNSNLRLTPSPRCPNYWHLKPSSESGVAS